MGPAQLAVKFPSYVWTLEKSWCFGLITLAECFTWVGISEHRSVLRCEIFGHALLTLCESRMKLLIDEDAAAAVKRMSVRGIWHRRLSEEKSRLLPHLLKPVAQCQWRVIPGSCIRQLLVCDDQRCKMITAEHCNLLEIHLGVPLFGDQQLQGRFCQVFFSEWGCFLQQVCQWLPFNFCIVTIVCDVACLFKSKWVADLFWKRHFESCPTGAETDQKHALWHVCVWFSVGYGCKYDLSLHICLFFHQSCVSCRLFHYVNYFVEGIAQMLTHFFPERKS